MSIHFEPIGIVQNQFIDKIPEKWESAVHRIVLEEKWAPALDGIEEFSHLYILFWLHGIKGEVALHVHPESRQDLPAVGLFATRTPYRPNPIGLQVVELIAREGNVLTVRGLDALNGSPVLDIKPYLPRGDSIPKAKIPTWLKKLWAEH
ncbi:MAG: tRNA (N6-threonylcarbamoyladenosine(37)-N6)-methyltransferase TrmO [Chloroflexi bacterium]|nr:tRNA (N6-threonylcarbamoyladenosine(37)-N6)-methyltransferase TrmO [Chloroflexota bacterium]